MTGSADKIRVDAVGQARSSLEAELAAARKGAWSVRIGCAIGALLLGLGFLVPIENEALKVLWAFVLFLLLIALAAIALATVFFSRVEDLEHRLALLGEEASQLSSARELTRAGEPFALFLRSFDPELRGLSAASVRSGTMLRARRQAFQARYGDFDIDYDVSHLEAGARWRASLRLLGAIQSRVPVLLLGNQAIEPEMRRELRALGVRELVIQAHDWWAVATDLAAQARAVIFFLESATPNLIREMEHVAERGYAYAVIGVGPALDALPATFPSGAGFLESAKSVLRIEEASLEAPEPIDAAALDSLLRKLGLDEPWSGS